MLVLSRRLNEKIVFPTIPAAVQIVSIKQGVVRLGIDAPGSVPVFREEVLQAGGGAMLLEAAPDLRKLNHLIRNRLNAAGVGLSLLKLQAAQDPRCKDVLERIESELKELQREVGSVCQQVPAAPASVRTRKALLVEDNQNERELLSAFLRMANFDVDTAGDGADALDYLHSKGRPDFVLLDMMMPRCDGVTMVRTLRRDPSYDDLKIFAISGYPPEQLGIDARRVGIDRWFQKPINAEALLGELKDEVPAGPGKPR